MRGGGYSVLFTLHVGLNDNGGMHTDTAEESSVLCLTTDVIMLLYFLTSRLSYVFNLIPTAEAPLPPQGRKFMEYLLYREWF